MKRTKKKFKTKKKVKEIKLQMKFNPGTMRYEPVFPIKEFKKLENKK